MINQIKNKLPLRHTRTMRGSWLVLGLLALGAILLGQCIPPGTGGEVHGYVYVEVRDQETIAAGIKGGQIFLPDIEVWLKNTSTAAESPRVRTDLKGFFIIPHQAAGTYDVCLQAPGYISGCGPKQVVIVSEMAFTGPIAIVPERPVVFGSVTLKDQTPCFFQDAAFGVDISTKVALVDPSGIEVVPAVRANIQGQYLVPKVPVGTFRVVATCEAAQVENPVSVSGDAQVNLILPSARPVVSTIVARVAGMGIRQVAPTTMVDVTVEAADPDGDTLRYQWLPSAAGAPFQSGNAATVPWTLPDSKGLHTMYVLVSDGRGGYALGTRDVSTSDGILFTGIVTANDAPVVPDAMVSINGQTAQTNAAGFFSIVVPQESDQYVVNIVKEGYQFMSKVLNESLVGRTYKLVRASKFVIDPTNRITVTEEGTRNREGAQVLIEANSLVDEDGNLATASLNLYLSTIDLLDPEGRFPGVYGGVSESGNVGLTTFGAVDIQITDGGGKLYNLAPGRTATVRIPIEPQQLEEGPPTTIPLWFYNPKTGLWEQEGTANLVGGFYEGKVTHLSVLNADLEFTNPACMRLSVDTTRLTLPFNIRFTVSTGTGVNPPITKTVADALSVIIYLPANQNVQIDVLDSAGNPIPAATQNVSSGSAIAGTADQQDDYPYSICNSQANLTFAAPAFPSAGFLNYLYGLSTPQEADQYYAAIDPTAAAGTGTVSSSGTSVNGNGTTFTSFFVAGDIIRAAGQVRTITLVTNDTQLETESAFNPAIPANTTFERVGTKTTFARWKTANGFDTGVDAQAIYFNKGDLGFGRWMAMRVQGSDIAYYVSNYPTADIAAHAKATNNPGFGLIATVAMEYSQVAGSGPRITKFYVFNAAGARVNKANLDGNGDKYIPKLCMICHGGAPAATPPDVQARWIGWDLKSFGYSSYEDPPLSGTRPYEQGPQEAAFRLLNQGLLSTNLSAAGRELITGWYGNSPGDTTLNPVNQDTSYVAPGFRPPQASPDKSDLYRDVVASACRSCHATRNGRVAWNVWDNPTVTFDGFKESGGIIFPFVCSSRDMPQAKRTWLNFWLSTSPHQPEALRAGGLDGTPASCP